MPPDRRYVLILNTFTIRYKSEVLNIEALSKSPGGLIKTHPTSRISDFKVLGWNFRNYMSSKFLDDADTDITGLGITL